MVIERFCARRGIPSVIWSDNWTNFVASEKELLSNIKNWNQKIFSESLVKKRIKWKFKPPSASHHGGVWELPVRSFKHVFHAVLGNRRLTDEILTMFCLVEQCLNARPITPVSPEATDVDALTSNHFLRGTASSTLPSHFRHEIDHRKRYASSSVFGRSLESLAQGARSKPQPSLEMVSVVRPTSETRRSCLAS